MKKLLIFTALAAIATGCKFDNLRDAELKGMYVNGYSETLAIGTGRLTSIPDEREALAAHYEEDTAWLQPSIKTHRLDIFIVGTNSTTNAAQILSDICKAFTTVAPNVVQTNADVAKSVTTATPLGVVKTGGETRKAVELAKATANEVKGQSGSDSDVTTADAKADCAAGACTAGACDDK